MPLLIKVFFSPCDLFYKKTNSTSYKYNFNDKYRLVNNTQGALGADWYDSKSIVKVACQPIGATLSLLQDFILESFIQ